MAGFARCFLYVAASHERISSAVSPAGFAAGRTPEDSPGTTPPFTPGLGTAGAGLGTAGATGAGTTGCTTTGAAGVTTGVTVGAGLRTTGATGSTTFGASSDSLAMKANSRLSRVHSSLCSLMY